MSVPADATVELNGVAMTSDGETRKFISPELPGEGPYYYHIQVEVERNGQKHVAECQQIVLPGRSYEVTFAEQNGSLVHVEDVTADQVASR